MKKTNIIILLLIPFLIAILGIVTVSLTYQTVDVDISHIEWDYDDLEPFKLVDLVNGNTYELNAKGVNAGRYEVSKGNELIWTIENLDPTDLTEYAKIEEKDGKNYLRVLKEGTVKIICTNAKGNVRRELKACIYNKGLIMVQPAIKTSQNNIDSTIYYGTKDINNNNLVEATIDLKITTIPADLKSKLFISEQTDNIDVDLNKELIKIKKDTEGEASVVIKTDDSKINEASFNFTIVKDGVNVYTYSDLLYCTNKSQYGEIVVLRKSFESIDNAYKKNDNGEFVLSNGKGILKDNNIECFGNYNFNSKRFSFINEVYWFETTYNDEYIKQWNNFAKNNKNYKEIDNLVYVGLRVQKSFYGNGYTLNLHNLTYPYSVSELTDASGNTHYIPELRADNIFRGPLPFYCLGDPNNMPLITALGQDNVGFYVDGINNNKIVVNDVNVKNCDFGDRLSNLDTVGTVIEIAADDATIKNSRFSSGKQVMRSFSSMNLLVENCALSNARNWLFVTGANEYIPVDGEAVKYFDTVNSTVETMKIKEYLASGTGAYGDQVLNDYLMDIPKEKQDLMRKALQSIHSALNNELDVTGKYKGTTEIKDTMFYNSGLASIALESLFNGPFLYSAVPSTITNLFDSFSIGGNKIIPYTPKAVSGISYPVTVNISGDTRFYDYKNVYDIDMNGLIDENITAIANSLGDMGYDGEITIDQIFPLKPSIVSIASDPKNNYNHYDFETKKSYAIIPIAYYGGGTNLSKAYYEDLDTVNQMSKSHDVNFLETYLSLQSQSGNYVSIMKNMMLKTVTVVTGYEPFKFQFYRGNGYLYGEAPSISDLIANANKKKGDK